MLSLANITKESMRIALRGAFLVLSRRSLGALCGTIRRPGRDGASGRWRGSGLARVYGAARLSVQQAGHSPCFLRVHATIDCNG